MSLIPNNLPTPSSVALAQSAQLAALMHDEINSAGGWIDFSRFMHMALYTPQLGYYSGGSQKIADVKKGGGDFVTAPEISPLFAQTLARQVAQVLQTTRGDVLELGAGTGRLASDLLLALNQDQALPQHYYILEVSNHLRQIQQETLQNSLPIELMQKVQWLESLPETFVGVVLGNEVLDAIPVHLVVNTTQGLHERGVTNQQDGFAWQDKAIANIQLFDYASQHSLPPDYLTELCPAANGLIASLADILSQGAILMIDYGFSATEYYHPQRNQGTLMCHYQHFAHSDPLIYVGLQDITAHVNFTAIAETALDNALQVAGFTTQAQFLVNCGITELLSLVSPDDFVAYLPVVAAVQKLVSPAEMGDFFKVIILTKNIDFPLVGFVQGDKRHTL